jgi:hypothetical protein
VDLIHRYNPPAGCVGVRRRAVEKDNLMQSPRYRFEAPNL